VRSRNLHRQTLDQRRDRHASSLGTRSLFEQAGSDCGGLDQLHTTGSGISLGYSSRRQVSRWAESLDTAAAPAGVVSNQIRAIDIEERGRLPYQGVCSRFGPTYEERLVRIELFR